MIFCPVFLVHPISAAANSTEDIGFVFSTFPLQNQDTVSLDTVCRLYEVGRQKLAEEGDDDDEVTTEHSVGLYSVFFFVIVSEQEVYFSLYRLYI